MTEKLVRNGIIYRMVRNEGAQGGRDYRVAARDEMPRLLRDKLQEEVKEYLDSGDPAELADIMEVIYALAAEQKVSKGELDERRLDKFMRLEGFDARYVLFLPPEKTP